VELIRPALEELGATIVVAGFPFGEYDVLVVYEAPDDMTAARQAGDPRVPVPSRVDAHCDDRGC
jgi:hypothetical protein